MCHSKYILLLDWLIKSVQCQHHTCRINCICLSYAYLLLGIWFQILFNFWCLIFSFKWFTQPIYSIYSACATRRNT
ncbi:hypothetical protein GLYMA_16G054250v4 [Glycine max]|nr:hypothetical protein GLYMA_16G054250v4 [Glycine max]KAH1150093.1 hypothetical protein GYH30_044231 [Glycine max]